MNLFETSEEDEYQRRRIRLFEKSWVLQEKLETISRMVGDIGSRSVLDIGSLGGLLGHFSRKHDLQWMCADFSAEDTARIRFLAGEPVAQLGEPDWPFEPKSFDTVIFCDRLSGASDAKSAVAEAHRVLAENGSLVILTPHRSSHSRSGVGHTEADLFELIRDGFDVQESQAFIRGLSFRLQRLIEKRLAGMGSSWQDICSDRESTDRAYVFLSRLYPLCWIASKLDKLMLLSRGRFLMLRARRRQVWRSRAAPQLHDGRSIADAALNTKIGSAADF